MRACRMLQRPELEELGCHVLSQPCEGDAGCALDLGVGQLLAAACGPLQPAVEGLAKPLRASPTKLG